MIFNCKTAETKLVKIGSEYIERVGDTSKEKSFKLVGIQVDEKLKWVEHINYIAKKINYANYCLFYTSPSPRDRQKSRMPSSA